MVSKCLLKEGKKEEILKVLQVIDSCVAKHLKSKIEFSCICFLFFFINLFIYILFLAALGLRCCTRAFSSCGERGLLFVAVRGLLIAVASLAVEQGL